MNADTTHARLSIGRALLDRLLAELAADPHATVRVPAGVRRDADSIEVIAPAATDEAHAPALLRAFRPPPGLCRATHRYWAAHETRSYPKPTLDLGLDPRGGCTAAYLEGRTIVEVREVLLVGPRLERWRPADGLPLPRAPLAQDAEFSRYAGALGGADALANLQSLTLGVVGCNRLGSVVAHALARAGARGLMLCDPDALERHSLDAADVDPADVGRLKVDAVTAELARVAPSVKVAAIATPIVDAVALAALAACDVIVSAPDDDSARLAAALVAAAYRRPHLDIGAGVFGERSENFDAGADVRLVLPGQCLVCFGGLDLTPRAANGDWRRERAGSLRSLNACAVGQALLLLERFVVGDLVESTWVRLRVRRDGRLTVESPTVRARPRCASCSAIVGLGDWAFAAVASTASHG